MSIRSVSFCLAATLVLTATASARTLTVCPAGVTRKCDFSGNQAIQAAVDKAVDGDVVQIRAGVYTPEKFIDVPYKQYVIRGAVAIQHKRVSLVAEPGAVLDGASGSAVSAILVNGGNVTVSNLTLRNLRAGDPEDDLYEGHGIFVLDATAKLHNVTIEKYAKMALTGRGSSSLIGTQIRIQDGHVAIWLEESTHLKLCNSVVRNNDSAGVAAYGNASASLYNSVFDANQDDGLYAEGDASIFATNSLLLNNKPYAVRMIGNARALVRHSIVFGNAAKQSSPEGREQVYWGEGVSEADPKVNAAYQLPVARDGDPDVRTPALSASQVGLSEVAACQAGS